MPMIADMGMGHAMAIPKDELKRMRFVPPGVTNYEFILSTTGLQISQMRGKAEPTRIFIPLDAVKSLSDWLTK